MRDDPTFEWWSSNPSQKAPRLSFAENLSHNFSRVIQQRGEHYVKDGRVRVTRQEPDRIEAEVRCSQPFKVEIELTMDGALDAECGCPYFQDHGPCKHIWATLLSLDDGLVAEVEVPEDDYVEIKSRKLPQEVTYVLDLDRARSRKVATVELHDHTQNIPRSFRIRREEVKRLPNSEDRALLGYLFQLDLDESEGESGGFGSSLIECSAFLLRNIDVVRAVELLCGTNRFYLKSHGRLRPSPQRWVGYTWRGGFRFSAPVNGECRLRGFLELDDSRIPFEKTDLMLDDVFLYGSEAHVYKLGAGTEWIEKIERDAATMGLDERDRLVVSLLAAENPPQLELPSPWRAADEALDPYPVLAIRGGAQALEGEDVDCALYFDYGGLRIPEHRPGDRFCDPEQHLVWQRKREAESSFRAALEPWAREEGDPEANVSSHRIPRSTLNPAVDALSQQGWLVELRERPYRGVGRVRLGISSGIDWLELEGSLEFGETTLDFAELIAAARAGRTTVELADGSIGSVPENWRRRLRLLSSIGTQQDSQLRFRRSQGWILDALLAVDEGDRRDVEGLDRREELQAFEGIRPEEEPETFEGELRPYQQEALGWFRFLRQFRFGGCLADDMGLGKTVQVLALLEEQRQSSERGLSIVVAPRSVVYNWMQEAGRFTPNLRALEFIGPDRFDALDRLDEYDLIVTSYGVLRRDILQLRELEFRYIVLDESQAIKNPNSQTAKCARLLRGDFHLALSGTPIENHLSELWSLFEFLNPGMLGESRTFQSLFSGRSLDRHEAALLAGAVRPLLLRRSKEQVANDLPAKTEQTLYCDMSEQQLGFYRQLSDHYRSTLLQQVEQEGLNRCRMHILEALLRLRQAACHPMLVGGAGSGVPEESCKLDLLLPQLTEIIEEGHKALVFSQFTSFLSIVRKALDAHGLKYEYLDGGTRNRRTHVDRFQNDPDVPIFLISLKAGGLGLNLTAADYVYILDPWWNPAVESQAIDRTHRIGQTRHVFAYRLICRNTVEEKILLLQEQKRELADSIIRADASLLANLSRTDLELLLS